MSHAEQLFDSVNKQAAAAAALERQNQPTRADRWFENRRRLLESYRSKNANEKPSRGESPAAYAKSA